MKTFKYLSLFYSERTIHIDTTDQETLDWIVASIKRSAPSYTTKNLPYGGVSFEKLQGKDLAIGSWIRSQLCLKGWEIITVTHHTVNGNSGAPTYHFIFETVTSS